MNDGAERAWQATSKSPVEGVMLPIGVLSPCLHRLDTIKARLPGLPMLQRGSKRCPEEML